MPQFILVYRKDKDTEELLNLDAITRIEVKYREVDAKGQAFDLGPTLGRKNDSAIKSYVVHYGGVEPWHVSSDPDNKILRVIEGFYKNAITGGDGPSA